VTFVTTNTMDPPPIPSILRRGEWFMGKVLEVYWKWSQLGDTYLGRCLAGLDPDSETFDVLPPHFTIKHEKAMENEFIREGMNLCFGPILEQWGDKCALEGILLLLLASMVYHSEFLITQIAKNSKHPFQSIPILQQQDLLSQLKDLVTLEPRGEVTKPSGVPRHVKLMKRITKTFEKVENCISLQEKMLDELPQTIADAINDKAVEAGQVTAQFVMEKLQEHSGAISAVIKEQIRKDIHDALREMNIEPTQQPEQPQQVPDAPRGLEVGGRRDGRFRDYKYADRSWAVPNDFDFPTAKLRDAWFAYLYGFPNNRSIKLDEDGKRMYHDEENEKPIMIRTPVRPLRFIRHDFLPGNNAKAKRIRNRFRDNWLPVLKIMHNANRAEIANMPLEGINHVFLQTTFNTGMGALKEKYPEIFEGPNGTRCHIWAVSTWNCVLEKVQRQKKNN
jgi:hypothetical protein